MYKIKQSNFEGPIDLLIYLIKKEELDIFSFNLLPIIDEYIEYVRLMEVLNIDEVIEFLYFVSVLLNIKSKKLLPKEENVEGQDIEEDEEALRLLMQERLEEYKKYKEVAYILREYEENMSKIYIRDFYDDTVKEEGIELNELSLFDLLTCFREILKKAKKEIVEIEPEKITVEDKIKYLEERLSNSAYGIRFFDLFKEGISRLEIIVTFLAILELMRLHRVRVIQRRTFDDIYIYR